MNRLLTAGPPRPCVPSARETSVSPSVERFPKRRKNSRRNAALGQQGRWHANITALQHFRVAGGVNVNDRPAALGTCSARRANRRGCVVAWPDFPGGARAL